MMDGKRKKSSHASKMATPAILKGFRREKTSIQVPFGKNHPEPDLQSIKEILENDIESVYEPFLELNGSISNSINGNETDSSLESDTKTTDEGVKISEIEKGFAKTIYGACSSNPPVRCYGKIDFNVNTGYGGCTGLFFVSCRKGRKTNAEIMLVRCGFDCNHVEVISAASCHTGYFSPVNNYFVNDDGAFVPDCNSGSNHLMMLTNDHRYGNLRNGIFMEIRDSEIPIMLPLSVKHDESLDELHSGGVSLIMCSGREFKTCFSAVYMIRLGTHDNEFEAKILSGEDKFKFDITSDGIITVSGPTGSRFGIFHNQNNLPFMPYHVYVCQTQCFNGKLELLNSLDDHSSLIVLCSNSYGEEDCTTSSVYHLSVKEANLVAKEISGCYGSDNKKSDLWTFELVDGKLYVTGPTGPCKYAILSNIKATKSELLSSVKQDSCLATGETTKTHGNVIVTPENITGKVSKPSNITIMMNHRTIRNIAENELEKYNDMYTFTYQWCQEEMVSGYHMIRVFAIRKNLESNEDVRIELCGSPFALNRQKPGVVYALNCSGPAYQDLNDIVYSSEYRQFTNFADEMPSKDADELQIHTTLPASMLKTNDGFLYTVTRTSYSHQDVDQKFLYKVNDIPNGTYKLRTHLTGLPENIICNGRSISEEIREEILKTFQPEDKNSLTCYCIDVDVEIKNNHLHIESRSGNVQEQADQLCAFALLDISYKDKVLTESQLKSEHDEKNKLADECPPLNTVTTRKDISIVGYCPNLLENATGENGDLKHWKVNGEIIVCEGGYDTDTCFVTSDMWCSKYQEVDLLKFFSAEYLDTAPDIMVLEDYKEGKSGGGLYCFTVQLLSQNRKVLKEHTTGQLGPLYYLKGEWEEANVVFSNYGPGVRIVAFSSKGKNDRQKVGYLGPFISGAEVRVRRKSTGPAVDDSYTDISKIKGSEKKSKLEKLVNKVLYDNSDLLPDFIKEEELWLNQIIDRQVSNRDTSESERRSSTDTFESERRSSKDIPDITDLWNVVKSHFVQRKLNFKKKLQKKREIRVFVSSTFKDFYKERDEIIKKAFKEINRLCADRGVFFTYVDLRWGITSEQASDGKTIAICLQEIERCRPYFICLMGERFGWSQRTGEDDDVLNMTYDYAIEHYPHLKWIDQYRYDSSVTQLEVFHGVLNNPKVDKDRCFFYMRNPPAKEGLSEEEYKILCSESEWHHERQESLKSQVRQQPGINVATFKTPSQVAELIHKDLESCIDEEFPKGTELTQLELMSEAHDAFASARQRVYIGSQEYFKEINTYREQNITTPLIILGESGSGKSSLIANWAKQIVDAEPDTFVFIHFIGSSADSSNYIKLIRRLFEEMKIFFDFDMNIPSLDSLLINEIGQWLRIAGSNTKVVIILDALNQLDDGTGEHGSEHDLLWIPSEIPPNVFLLMSTLPGKALRACMGNGWPSMKVQPLQDSQKLQIITNYLEGIYGKALNNEQKEMLVNVEQTSNPLYLKSLLDEIRMFGKFRQLTEKIEEYLTANNPQELFAKILERLEQDFEKGTHSRKNLVHDVTTALWCSNRGMSESELVEMLDLPSIVWSPFYLSLYESLVNRNGILNFFHDHLRQAVQKKYLSTPEAKKKRYLQLAEFFSSKEISNRTVEELPFLWTQAREFDKLKATITDLNVFYRLADDEDGKFELIKAWRKLGGFSLSEEAYMSELWKIPKSTVMANLKYYCRLYSLLGNFFSTLGLIDAAKKVYKTLIKILELNFDETYDTIVYSAFNQSWIYRCNHPDVIKSLQDLGTVYFQLGRKDKAISVYNDAICRQNRIVTPTQKLKLLRLPHPLKLVCQNIVRLYFRLMLCDGLLGLSTVYIEKDNMLEAKKLMTRALELATSVLGKKHHFVADIYTKLGQLAYQQHRLDEALGNFLHDLKATRNEFGTNHPYTANILNEVALVYDDKNDELAGELYEAALRITLATYGNNYLVTGTIRYNLGAFYYGTDRFEKARYQFTEAYKIYVMFLGDNHPDTISVKRALDTVS